MDNEGDLLEDMDYGDFGLLEEPSGEFSFDATFDGDFSSNSAEEALNVSSNNATPPQQQQQQQQPLQPQPQLQKPVVKTQTTTSTATVPPMAPSSSSAAGQAVVGLNGINSNSSSVNTNQNALNNNAAPRNNTSSSNEPNFDLLQSSNNNLPSRQAWHNDEKDRDARRRMIIEIAQLLRARKRNQPSDAWLRQLPCKARKLEERLYRSAPSFDFYDDKTTLKNRLKKLARAIMMQYEHTSHSRSSIRSAGTLSTMSSRASTLSTGPASRNNSVMSHLQQHRDSMMSQGSLDSLSSLNASMNQLGGSNNAAAAADRMNHSNNSHNSSSGQLPGGNSGNSSSGPSPGLVPIPEENKTNSSNSNNRNPSSDSNNVNMLEHQKRANERLQQQIMENIRKQEELLRHLQQQAASGGGSGGNNQMNQGTPNNSMMPHNSTRPIPNMMPNNNNNAVQAQRNFMQNANAPGSTNMMPNNLQSRALNMMQNNSGGHTQPRHMMQQGVQSTSSSSTTGSMPSAAPGTMPQNTRQTQPQHQQLQRRPNGPMAGGGTGRTNNNNVAGVGGLNNLMMNAPGQINPAQMQQLAQMQALLRSGQMTPHMQNQLMRSVSMGNAGTMMGGAFGGAATGQQQQQQQQQAQQQNPMAMAGMLGQNLMGLPGPPVLPGRAVSTGSMNMGGFSAGGFNPTMPPPQGAANVPGGASAPGNNAAASFSQFNWRTNT